MLTNLNSVKIQYYFYAKNKNVSLMDLARLLLKSVLTANVL